ncbi:hypothetical protein L1987_18922 [Smallanthus sonchifolius]|uniref:Uncharacterized protein n=1 Tax=Smallanthus sonchifolius TaxID=185202 RepID=A0ACB9J3M4_9ASTR|nr:hypothetical protein L1987_18922 [Smallanthus sonchifolius]
MRHSPGKRKRQDITFRAKACQSPAQHAKGSSMLIAAARSASLKQSTADPACLAPSAGCGFVNLWSNVLV